MRLGRHGRGHRGSSGLARGAAVLATIVVAGVTVGAGFGGGSTDTAPDTGYHYPLGSRGEEDVNVCSPREPRW